ncbi:gustatory receptor 84 [Tribolium castaneum]|uniref:Gustatory receptor n=1 Tax=Tribolium castaneum TaxID=7070 RepID=B8PUM2_TRICA|nr:gustatory receptor [Tribolium castaneum]EFA05785.1 gustatory receptor 84 [Tribolium castaneum]
MITMGKSLALIPLYPSKNSLFKKVYSVFVIVFITIWTLIANFYRISYYKTFVPTKLINNILFEIVSYSLTVATILNAILYGKNKWYVVLDFLKNKEQKYVCYFAIANAFYWVIVLYAISVWVDFEGNDYFKKFSDDVVLFYNHFYICCFIYIFTKEVKNAYKSLNMMLKLPKINKIQDLQNRVASLKNTIDSFNELFGLPFVCIIFTTGVTVVDFLDDILKNSYGYSRTQHLRIVAANLITIISVLIPTVGMILSCQQVYGSATVLLNTAYNLRRGLVGRERQEVTSFINTLLNHFPNFTAANFFRIDKSVVFRVLGVVTTYLIVVVQFNASSDT